MRRQDLPAEVLVSACGLHTGCSVLIYFFFPSFELVELKRNEGAFVEPVIMELSENCTRLKPRATIMGNHERTTLCIFTQ